MRDVGLRENLDPLGGVFWEKASSMMAMNSPWSLFSVMLFMV
jgi:hypothetical protein